MSALLVSAILLLGNIHTGQQSSTPIDLELKRFSVSRVMEIDQLIAVARTGIETGDDYMAVLAVRKLGVLRAAEAVPMLVAEMKYSPSCWRHVKRTLSLSESLPCVFTLGQIGSPSLNDIVARVQSTDDPEDVVCSAAAIKLAVGCDDGIAMLRQRVETATNRLAATRLQRLVNRIDKYERGTLYR